MCNSPKVDCQGSQALQDIIKMSMREFFRPRTKAQKDGEKRKERKGLQNCPPKALKKGYSRFVRLNICIS